ncbi:patched family protein [Ancylostoma ceylanicum]|uniref:Patched family protein n=1 Tax=Ancylostoma ceylanicum TaxID=53326 RepID=A0A0D6M0H6_9BILA|nr:patched family protein [Ancylostoma ceylanicum]
MIYAPWTCIVLSCVATAVLTLKIPFTAMENNISDFTPYDARSRQELKIYREFFSNRGEPKTIYAFVSAKDGVNMLKTAHLNETVQVLDKISRDFYLRTSKGKKNFEQFCQGFCTLNEPIRHFYSGMLISDKYANRSRHLDLGYPITTVLGTKLYMDPNLFGVKIAVRDRDGHETVVSTADGKHKDYLQNQLPNNIREIALIVLQFRAEIGTEVKLHDMKEYERSIVEYFQKDFKSDLISVNVLTDSFITSEIVRSGLTLLPFLVIGFVIMATFSSVTFSISATALKQMNIHKITLAVMACVTPFMACGASLGGMFWANFRFGSILCVTPFLVLAIGVDDAYLMVNAWQRITTHRRKMPIDNVNAEVRRRITEMLVETGPSVSITTITNVLAFGIGALTPTPEIQLFSIGNALAVVVDFIFQLTIYAALMVIIGRREIQEELEGKQLALQQSIPSEKKIDIKKESAKKSRYISIVGTLSIKAELTPSKLFLEDSDLAKIFTARKKFITPYYSVCWVLVERPGDVSNRTTSRRIHDLVWVSDFENLPSSVGQYSTKFWLRDYEDFLRQAEELDVPEEFEEEPETAIEFSQNGSARVPAKATPESNELKQFLEWPEFSFWKGFIQVERNETGGDYKVTRFFFTTAFHGEELVEWSNRAILLNQWRSLADKYSDLGVSIYEDDAKFLDLIETMVPVSTQSALFTFISMFAVAVLFISHPPTLFVATLSILSTSIGVFGIMALRGAELDPIMMSATVMSIGFSVDIPSHIAYHYYQTGKEFTNVRDRLEQTVAAVGFPILQASLSTTLCVLSLFFVKLHMSQEYVSSFISTLGYLLVVPVITVPEKTEGSLVVLKPIEKREIKPAK